MRTETKDEQPMSEGHNNCEGDGEMRRVSNRNGEEQREAGEERREGWRAVRTPLGLALSLGGLHVLGVRTDAVVLSGTAPLGVGTLLGLIYVGLWLVCVVAVPPWLAGLLAERWLARVAARTER